MSGLIPYLLLPGTAREALTFYQETFGGTLVLNSYADFGRTDGPADAIAHGMLTGTVELFAADLAASESTSTPHGVMFSLLGTADPTTLREWFDRLHESGTVIDPLARKPWGASDGQVIDRFGIHWLIGFED